jgi:hypothetical protein
MPPTTPKIGKTNQGKGRAMSTPQAILANNIEAETPEDRERLEELYVIGKDIPTAPDDLPEPQFSDNAW